MGRQFLLEKTAYIRHQRRGVLPPGVPHSSRPSSFTPGRQRFLSVFLFVFRQKNSGGNDFALQYLNRSTIVPLQI